MDDPVKRAEHKNNYGNNYFRLKQYGNAINEYTEAIKICPQISKYYGNRSACYLMLNEFVKALSDARKSIELDKGNKKGYIRIGKCCFANGNIKYAEDILFKAKGIFPEDIDILTMYEDTKCVQENISLYEIKMKNKQFKEALKCIEICVEKAPNCVKYITNKCRCLIHLDKLEEAEKLADSILQYKSADEDALYIKTIIQINRTDTEEALRLSKELKKKLPDHSGTNKLFRSTSMLHKNNLNLQVALTEKNYNLAYELLTKSIKIDESRKTHNKKLYKQKITIAGKDKDLLWNGVEDCTNYMNIYEKDTQILQIKAQYNMDLQEYEDAVEDYKELIQLENTPYIKEQLRMAESLLEEQLKSDFKILKISESATVEEIKNAEKELMKRYHPDKNPKTTVERKKILEKKLMRVREAKRKLMLKYGKNM